MIGIQNVYQFIETIYTQTKTHNMEMLLYVFTHVILIICVLVLCYIIGAVRTEPGDQSDLW